MDYSQYSEVCFWLYFIVIDYLYILCIYYKLILIHLMHDCVNSM